MRKTVKALLALLLVTSFVLAAGCGGGAEVNPDSASSLSEAPSEPDPVSTSAKFANPLDIPVSASTVGVANTGSPQKAVEKFELNDETIGWLYLPETTLDEQVMFHPAEPADPQTERFYYLRRDFNKVPNTGPLAGQYGSYFADYRSLFTGGRAGMSRNTVIYGHSMSDDPNGGGFSPLKKYLDEDFAKENPYVYFSLRDEDLAWGVFAVFYATVNLPYNIPDTSDEDFTALMEECRARSIYNYDAEVGPEDKILTLSTCCYNYTASYPNNYRYVVMAKLVEPGHMTATEAAFTKNPAPKAP